MSIPRTGSQGLSRDLWALTHAACYEPHPVEGHAAIPNEKVLARFAMIDVPFDPANPAVPFSPSCKKCRQVAKRVMEKRGLTREQIKRCYDEMGAKWEWTSRESDEKRRTADTGVMVVSATGVLTVDKNEKAKARRATRRIEHKDRHPDPEPLRPSAETVAESHRIDKMWGGK